MSKRLKKYAEDDDEAGNFVVLDDFRKRYSNAIDEINQSISGIGEKIFNEF